MRRRNELTNERVNEVRQKDLDLFGKVSGKRTLQQNVALSVLLAPQVPPEGFFICFVRFWGSQAAPERVPGGPGEGSRWGPARGPFLKRFLNVFGAIWDALFG